MSWAKLDDKFFAHPKVIRTSFAARGLWVMALSWSSAMGTDGFIPLDCMRTFCGSLRARDRRRLGSELVAAGLWEGRPDGYQIHDFLDHNPSANQLKEKREQEAARLREYRKRTDVRTKDRTRLPSRPGPEETDLLRGFDRQPQRSSSGAVSRSSEGATKAKRGWRRVPPNEALTPERLQMGRKVSGRFGSELKRAWGAFVDYEFQRDHHDVDAAWRNWCRKEWAGRAAPPPAPYKRDPAPPIVRGLLANIGRPVPAQEDDPDPPVPSAEQTRAMLYDK